MAFTAIGFDWGGVLNGRPSTYLNAQVIKFLGVSQQDFLTAYFKHNKKVNRGEISWAQLWKLVLSDLGCPEKAAEVERMSAEANKDNLNLDVLNLVDRLKSCGYKVGLLSNNTDEKAALLRASGLDSHFDIFHISSETRLVKPEPQAFQHFATDLGVNIKNLIFIDDSSKSLSTAEECGFTPILFESYTQLLKALRALNVRM